MTPDLAIVAVPARPPPAGSGSPDRGRPTGARRCASASGRPIAAAQTSCRWRRRAPTTKVDEVVGAHVALAVARLERRLELLDLVAVYGFHLASPAQNHRRSPSVPLGFFAAGRAAAGGGRRPPPRAPREFLEPGGQQAVPELSAPACELVAQLAHLHLRRVEVVVVVEHHRRRRRGARRRRPRGEGLLGPLHSTFLTPDSPRRGRRGGRGGRPPSASRRPPS